MKIILYDATKSQTLPDQQFLEHMLHNLIEIDPNVKSLQDVEEIAFARTLSYLVSIFQRGEATLSSSIYKCYVQECTKLGSGKFKPVNDLSSWRSVSLQCQEILGQRLEMYTQNDNPRLGTLLFFTTCNLKNMLHKTLFQIHATESKHIPIPDPISDSQESVESLVESVTDDFGDFTLHDKPFLHEAEVLQEAATILHENIKVMTKELEALSAQVDLKNIDLMQVTKNQSQSLEFLC